MAELREVETQEKERVFRDTAGRLLRSLEHRTEFDEITRRGLREIHNRGKKYVAEFTDYLGRLKGLNVNDLDWLRRVVREHFSKL